MSATGDGLSAVAREQLGFPPEREVDVAAQLAELRASRAAPAVPVGVQPEGECCSYHAERGTSGVLVECQPEAGVGVQPAERAETLAADATLGERVRAAFGPGSVAVHAFVEDEVAAVVAALREDLAAKVADALDAAADAIQGDEDYMSQDDHTIEILRARAAQARS